MAIPIDLRRDDPHSLQEQIYTQIRRLILSGRLATRERLPSSREWRVISACRGTPFFMPGKGGLDITW
jgi:hypothetical protein